MSKPSPLQYTRRQAIGSLVSGSILMPGILSQLLAEEDQSSAASDPLAPKGSHFPAKAKQVIFIFLAGGFSQLDTFDLKPALYKLHDKQIPIPGNTGRKMRVVQPYWDFKPRGECGMLISDLFPHLAERADDLCVIRSLHTDHRDHTQASMGMHTGSVMFTRPCIGSWVSYGLGTFNQNLPSFMVFAPNLSAGGEQLWASDFLPAIHQGTRVVGGPVPIPNVARVLPQNVQEIERTLLDSYNQGHLKGRDADTTLDSRIRSFEMAFGMQREAPEAMDLSGETDATLKLYGVERGETSGFGAECITARRLIERGVRFIEIIETGPGLFDSWDSHNNMMDHVVRAKSADQPIAALIQDLKSRGMFDETLVVIATEFGRPPFEDGPKGKGRSHQATAFTSILAGGGTKGGMTYGVTDELGINVVKNPVHVNDFHATILHLMGMDHKRLTFRHSGRDFRLTDVGGNVVKDILA